MNVEKEVKCPTCEKDIKAEVIGFYESKWAVKCGTCSTIINSKGKVIRPKELDDKKYIETLILSLKESKDRLLPWQKREIRSQVKSLKETLRCQECVIQGLDPFAEPEKKERGFKSLWQPSDLLSEILGSDEPKTRAQITKGIWDYIREKGLQGDKEKYLGDRIFPDLLFSRFAGQELSFQIFQLSKMVAAHVTKIEKKKS